MALFRSRRESESQKKIMSDGRSNDGPVPRCYSLSTIVPKSMAFVQKRANRPDLGRSGGRPLLGFAATAVFIGRVAGDRQLHLFCGIDFIGEAQTIRGRGPERAKSAGPPMALACGGAGTGWVLVHRDVHGIGPRISRRCARSSPRAN